MKSKFPLKSAHYIELFECLTGFGGLNNKKAISLIGKLYGLKDSYLSRVIYNKKAIENEKIKLIKK